MFRELEGVRYHILDATEVSRYVKEVAEKEWSAQDFEKYGNDLRSEEWKLHEVDVADIVANADLLATEEFQKDLQPRIESIRNAIDSKGEIPPLILRAFDLLIFDGYARYHVFKEKNIQKCLAYVNGKVHR